MLRATCNRQNDCVMFLYVAGLLIPVAQRNGQTSQLIVHTVRVTTAHSFEKYSVILSVLDQRKCEYLKDYSLDFEHAYMTAYLAS